MGNNNLYKVENTLRSIAKRYKSVKYSLGLAILFLMMGVGAFSAEVNDPQVNGVPTREEIATSKENLRNHKYVKPSENLDKLIEEGKIEYAEEYVSLEKEAKQWEREKTQQQQ